jgi:hypothetical protein
MAIESVARLAQLGGTLVNIVYLLLILAILVAVYYLAKWGWNVYQQFTSPGGQVEKDIANMFTPHLDDGTVAPKDIAPKGTDQIDWLFMNHEDAT